MPINKPDTFRIFEAARNQLTSNQSYNSEISNALGLGNWAAIFQTFESLLKLAGYVWNNRSQIQQGWIKFKNWITSRFRSNQTNVPKPS